MSRCLTNRSTADSELGPAEFLRGQWNVTGLPVFARYRNNSSFSFSRRLSSVTASRIARRLQRIGNENAKPGRLAPAFHPALPPIDVGGMMIWLNSCFGKWWRRRESNDLGC
jgi:hypothetical protein